MSNDAKNIIATLRDTLGHMEVVLANIKEAIVWTDSCGKILWCNERFDKLVAQQHLLILGQDLLDVVSVVEKKFGPEANQKIKDLNLTQDEFFETLSFTTSAEKLYLKIFGKKIESKGKAIFVYVISNVTKQKLLEQQLLQSQKMESIGVLAAGIAHEINNPLGFIMNNQSVLTEYVDAFKQYYALQTDFGTLLEANTDSNIQKQLKKIIGYAEEEDFEFVFQDLEKLLQANKDGLERLKRIVQGLKSFSHAEEEKVLLADINHCLDSALELASYEIKYKAEVTKVYSESPKFYCFGNHLIQVFLNMIINSVHAIDKEPGLLKISTSYKKPIITIEIEDNGTGIPEEIRTKLFNPFFTTKPVGQGTGLGLAMAYEVIKNHGGEIQIESEVGSGTKFIVYIDTSFHTMEEVSADGEEI